MDTEYAVMNLLQEEVHANLSQIPDNRWNSGIDIRGRPTERQTGRVDSGASHGNRACHDVDVL